MTNNKQETVVEWLWEIAYNRDLTLEDWKQAKERYNDEIEAAAIISSATESTRKATWYAEGYTEGYKRALELVEWGIEQVKIKTIKK